MYAFQLKLISSPCFPIQKSGLENMKSIKRKIMKACLHQVKSRIKGKDTNDQYKQNQTTETIACLKRKVFSCGWIKRKSTSRNEEFYTQGHVPAE